MCATPYAPRSGPVPQTPERVGRYDILLPIASGGMASVYLARAADASDDSEPQVALKLTHAHLRRNQEFARHLLEEAKLAAGIHHPNVVPVLDVGDDPLGIYLVMEYVDGDTLGNVHRQAHQQDTTLPLRAGMRILVDALSGLHAAHELPGAGGGPLNLVHRDFTPQNILIGLDGVARLTDFGIAKAASRLSHTATGIVKGKIAYMSPEQARGRHLDRRADVFSAGVIAWELAAGRRLHESETDFSLLLKVANEPAPLLSSVVSGLPPDLEQVVASALTLDADERCPTADEFAQRLVRVLEPAGLLGTQEEVAGEIQRILGAKLERRRQRVRDSSQRHGAWSSEEDGETTATGMDQGRRSEDGFAYDEPTASRLAASRAAKRGALHTPCPDDAPLQSDPSVRSWSHSGVQVPPRPQQASQTEASVVPSAAPGSRAAPIRMGIAIALGAVVALAVTVPVAFVTLDREPQAFKTSGASQSVPSVPSSVPVASSPAPIASTPPPSSREPMAEASSAPAAPSRSVEFRGNAKISALVVDGVQVPIVEPGAILEVDLPKIQGDKAIRVHAIAVDGSKARAWLRPGQVRVALQFEHPKPGPTSTSADAQEEPLAPNPYGL